MKKPAVLEKQCAALRAKNERPESVPVQVSESGLLAMMREKHYTVEELATTWGISDDKVRDIFSTESGVFDASKNPHGKDRRKRRHRFLLIPESVVLRVYKQRLIASAA
jgi:hypothetical protein